MFKFLRKYSKWILAVGGTLLMITFLIPQAIQSLTQQAARRGVMWARVGPDEEKVSSDVLRQCQAELQALDDLGQGIAGIGRIKQPEHWYLLQREADQAGLIGGWASDVLSAEDMAVLIGRTANPPRTVDEALGKLNSVNQLVLMYANGARLSDQRLRGYARHTFHVADARIVVLAGDPDADVPDPTEDEIVAQFETYRGVEPGEGERGFGYRRPDRFKIEWLTIPADSIRTMVEAGDELNAIALAKHWQKNQASRGFPEVDPSGPVPDVVREDLLSELAEAKRAEVERYANNMLLDSWRNLKTTRDGYRVAPDDWAEQRVDFTAIAEAVRDKFPGLELPAYTAIGDRWLALDDMDEFDELNSASTDKFGRPVAVRQLLASIREFGGEADIPMQVGLAAPPLRNASGNIVFLRVTDVDPARPARDVDEVRDEIVDDLRRLAHFEQLRERTDAIEAAARENGLLYVAVENDAEVQRTTPMSLYDPQRVNFLLNYGQIGASPVPTDVPGLGPAPDAVQTIIERALAFPLDAPLQDQPVEDRTFVVPVDDQMTLLVVQFERHAPLDQARFDQLCQAGLETLVLTEEIRDTELPLTDVFGYDALAARHQFVVQQRKDDEAEETDAADDDEAAPEPAAAASN